MSNAKKIGILLLLVVLINITPNTLADSYENYITDKEVTALRPGDEIFFDNSGTNWENVYIYIWGNNGEYKSWNDANAMTKIEGTNIYKFVVPNDESFTANDYKKIIFKNGYSGRSNQTINLGFIESGFSYLVTGQYTGDYLGSDYAKDKKTGYWYLYDKAPIVEHLDLAKQYQQNKAKYTEESYSDLDDLITQATTELESEIKLQSYQENGNDNGYFYINIATTLKAIDNIIQNLKVYEGNINIQTDENGTITTNQEDNSKVEIGTLVNLTVNPNQYYEINQINIMDENGNNVSINSNNTFIMPKSNVTVNATFNRIQKAITTNSENGSVTTNQIDDSKVNAGETVTLTLTPNQWCELESLTLKDAEGNDITVTNNTFTMPTSDVIINAKFKEINKTHDIIINTTENGSVVTDVGLENINVETPVNITITPNDGYELDTLTVKDTEGNVISVTNNTFIMPDKDVIITTTFKNNNMDNSENIPDTNEITENNTTIDNINTDNNTITNDTFNSPKTGDTIVLWVSLMLVSAFGVVETIKFIKKR